MDIEELIRVIMGYAGNIRRKLGPGYLESVYKNAMIIELKKHHLPYEVEKPIHVYYDGFLVGEWGGRSNRTTIVAMIVIITMTTLVTVTTVFLSEDSHKESLASGDAWNKPIDWSIEALQ
jgi:GxxExxY protein